MTDLSPAARAAFDAALATRGPRKGMLLARAPASRTLAYAAWNGAMVSANPYKASIAGMIFMSAEQHGIRAEVTAWVDAQPKRARMALDRDRANLERLGAW